MLSIADIYHVAPVLFYVVALAIGLLVGSFLNVVIYRLPLMMQRDWEAECEFFIKSKEDPEQTAFDTRNLPENFNLAVPKSTCPGCGAPVKPWQNIPVLSFLALKGKCYSCKSKISVRYPIIEAVTGIASFLLVFHFGASPQAYFGLALLWALIALTMIDADHQLLPDDITYPLLWLGLIANLLGTYTDLQSAVIGAMAGYLSLWSVYWGFKLLTGKEGMGYGDFKLLAALGAWMGWQVLPVIILLSSLVGAILGIGAILVMGRDKAKPLPFGPYLAIAGMIAFVWGDQIIQAYLQSYALPQY